MADEPTGDDGLTQRERRAQRHRSTRATRAPTDWARKARAAKTPIIILLIVAAGVGAVIWLNLPHDCPDHWHATQRVFVPDGMGSDGYDIPHTIDWNAPKNAANQIYYNYGIDDAMSPTMHMHQSGPEQGSEALGPTQFHFEGNGKCIGIQNAYSEIDLSVDSHSVTVMQGTPLYAANIKGTSLEATGGHWEAGGNHTLRFFLETNVGNNTWAWSERSFDDYKHYQAHDMESFMVAFGHYSDAQLQSMMDQIPAPISRPGDAQVLPFYTPPVVVTTTPTSSSTT
ncbi:MAG: hypothetical protein V4510_07670 [bacterium]